MLKIEKGVPIKGPRGGTFKQVVIDELVPFDKMEVGDSVEVPTKMFPSKSAVTDAVSHMNRIHKGKKKFGSAQTEAGRRVWRVQ